MTEPLFIKVCGLRTEQDVDTAIEEGADAIGFVFAESPRRIDTTLALKLARRTPEHVLTVGVFRNQPLEEVRSLTAGSGIRGIQLHGQEGPDYYEALSREGRTLIRGTAYCEPAPRCGEFGEDILLLDAPIPGAGIAWDWTKKRSDSPREQWLLAGGLTPKNVQDAVRAVQPWGVDVSSGVEKTRGVKDPGLIASFIRAARSAI
ncbi:phosphoribosylanthranilate isomerase [Sinosporangium siamense]|uniref:N-(5'-phosphoribosyl)anthranilate isomerase n=1 Tax=Sinosporangium siamense TaxID=1367973 RepID=A0A919VGS0_9ACTN|nr:phosphoribosylanthranilate isomerase [Sinosporangium siamense]GII97384.1 N-(5'-phosphoribosyl)anthranilate isomerase [Sinosporangium siamense]